MGGRDAHRGLKSCWQWDIGGICTTGKPEDACSKSDEAHKVTLMNLHRISENSRPARKTIFNSRKGGALQR